MPKYLCVQRKLPTEETSQKPSPEQMEGMYARFNDWMEKFGENLVDTGGKLGDGKLVTLPSTEGPSVEVSELVGGYMIVEAADLEEAIGVARECPGLVSPGSGVEVIEIQSQ